MVWQTQAGWLKRGVTTNSTRGRIWSWSPRRSRTSFQVHRPGKPLTNTAEYRFCRQWGKTGWRLVLDALAWKSKGIHGQKSRGNGALCGRGHYVSRVERARATRRIGDKAKPRAHRQLGSDGGTLLGRTRKEARRRRKRRQNQCALGLGERGATYEGGNHSRAIMEGAVAGKCAFVVSVVPKWNGGAAYRTAAPRGGQIVSWIAAAVPGETSRPIAPAPRHRVSGALGRRSDGTGTEAVVVGSSCRSQTLMLHIHGRSEGPEGAQAA